MFGMSGRSLLVLAGLLAYGGLYGLAPAQDLRSELTAGRRLAHEAASALEEQLEEAPGNLAARVQLIAYYHRQYSTKETGGNFQARLKRAMFERWKEHLLWMIRNAPETEVLSQYECSIWQHEDQETYALAKAAWSQHLERMPRSLEVLKNVAEFYRRNDPALAIEVFERIQAMDGANPRWARELGDLYQRDILQLVVGGGLGGPDPVAAARALHQYERAYELSRSEHEDPPLRYLAWTAWAAGQTSKARAYAEAMLRQRSDDRGLGDRIHHGHLILGMIALADGKLEQAKDHLLDAGRSPESPRLYDRGPNMVLAQQLLEHGETEAVVSYLELCSTFWRSGKGRRLLPMWIEMVEAGEIPIFGQNLLFH